MDGMGCAHKNAVHRQSELPVPMTATTHPPTVFVTAPRLAPAGLQRLQAAHCRVLYLQEGGGEAEVAAVLARESVDAVISRTATLSAAAIAARSEEHTSELQSP